MSAAEKEIAMQDTTDKVRLAVLETTTENVGSTLSRIERRFDNIDKKFDQMDARFNFLETKFDKKFEQIDKSFDDAQKELIYLHKENQANFKWIMGVILGLYGIIISCMGKGWLVGH